MIEKTVEVFGINEDGKVYSWRARGFNSERDLKIFQDLQTRMWKRRRLEVPAPKVVSRSGVHFYRWVNGVQIEETREEFLARCEYYRNPIWDSVVRDLGVCINCLCSDCGCCHGCGDINADLFGAHGYACTVGTCLY